MSTFAAQPASSSVLHCYARGDAEFDSDTPAKVLAVSGIRRVHLVTAGRSKEQWCLVLEPNLPIEQDNVERLYALVAEIGRCLGLVELQLLRPAVRGDNVQATDRYDWLKW